MIVEEGHLTPKDEMKFGTRKNWAHYGLQKVELQQEAKKVGRGRSSIGAPH